MAKGKAFVRSKIGTNKTKCTHKFIDKMCNYLRTGAYPETAAVLAGVDRTTFLYWMKVSHNPQHPDYKPIYAKCRDRVVRVMEEVTVKDLHTIDKASSGWDQEYHRHPEGKICPETGQNIGGEIILDGKGNPLIKRKYKAPDWGAAAWRLERRAASQWGRKDTLNMNVNGGTASLEGGEEDDPSAITVKFVAPKTEKEPTQPRDVTPKKENK
jgi:hypothetical protein